MFVAFMLVHCICLLKFKFKFEFICLIPFQNRQTFFFPSLPFLSLSALLRLKPSTTSPSKHPDLSPRSLACLHQRNERSSFLLPRLFRVARSRLSFQPSKPQPLPYFRPNAARVCLLYRGR
jgi:hypothetical protein